MRESGVRFVGMMLVVMASLSAFAGVGEPVVTRGPYLQMGTSSSMVVRWRTDVPAMGRVYYGTRVNRINGVADGTSSTTEHEVHLTGLRQNRRYYYAVGTVGAPAPAGDPAQSFFTSPRIGSAHDTRVLVLGDSGTADANAAAVRQAYEQYAGGSYTDVWLMLGDNAYNSGTDAQYGAAVFDMYPDLLRTTPVWAAIGNHDNFDGMTNRYPYFDVFTLPTQGEAGGHPSGTEAYYSFDHGNIHFICLDSYQSNRSPTGPMLTWLEEDLMLTDADWVIVYWHHPPYSKGSHDSDNAADSGGLLRDMRENALPILDGYGVDLVLAGHSHSYERSVLLDGHYGTSDQLDGSMILDDGLDGLYEKSPGSVPHDGAVYVVAGSSGKTSGGPLNHPVMVVSLNRLGSLVLDIEANRLSARFLGTGQVEDDFVIVKGGPVCGDGSIDSGETCDDGALDGETCESQGCSGGGVLACSATCDGFDTSGCLDCATCAPKGDACSIDDDCCSNKCRGPAGRKTCK